MRYTVTDNKRGWSGSKSIQRCWLEPAGQKRTLLFAEYLDEQLLLSLPHRQFVFTLPKALRVFLRHDQRLFAKLARLIFNLITQFYRTAASIPAFCSELKPPRQSAGSPCPGIAVCPTPLSRPPFGYTPTPRPAQTSSNLPASGMPHAFGQLLRAPASSALPCRPGTAAAAGIVVHII
jgi:hypothetical protein